MNYQIVATLLASFSLGLSSYAAAGVNPAPAGDAPSKEVWVQRIAEAQQAVDAANARYARAVAAYGHMRHYQRERGEEKQDILEEQENARGEVARATRQLEDVLEEARRSGVPPGWVREALEPGAAPAARDH